MDLTKLPSTFYRISLKAIILNDDNKLLVEKDGGGNGHWEIPGGGWEYGEALQDGLKREIKEELGVEAEEIGQYRFLYRGLNPKGYMVIYMAFDARLKNYDFKFVPSEITEARFVNKEELMELEMDPDEDLVKEHVSEIWRSGQNS